MFPLFLFGSLFLDLLTKYYVQAALQGTHYILGDVLYFQFIKNPGIAFSLPLHGLLLKVVTIVLIVGISYHYIYKEEKIISNKIGYGLLLGGALGNAYERIVYGSVTDFIGIKYFSIFNIADISICLGVFILIIINYAKGHTKPN